MGADGRFWPATAPFFHFVFCFSRLVPGWRVVVLACAVFSWILSSRLLFPSRLPGSSSCLVLASRLPVSSSRLVLASWFEAWRRGCHVFTPMRQACDQKRW